LRHKTPEAQDLLLAEREGVHRRYLPEAHDLAQEVQPGYYI
jgi:hypothetical protein